MRFKYLVFFLSLGEGGFYFFFWSLGAEVVDEG